jgi:hypothetical protein
MTSLPTVEASSLQLEQPSLAALCVDSLSSDEEEWLHDHNHNTFEIFPQVNFDDLDSSNPFPPETPANPVDDEKVQMFYRIEIFRLEAKIPSSLRLASFIILFGTMHYKLGPFRIVEISKS